MPGTIQLTLLRHGQSEANAGRTTDGPDSAPLTPLGVRQARAIAATLDEAPELIVHSSYRRARETAAATVERFSSARVEEWPVQEFHYLGPTAYRGTTKRDRRSQVDAYWRTCDPELVCEPGAESFVAFLARVRAVRQRLESAHERRIAVFSHKKFLHALLWTWSDDHACADTAGMVRFRAFDRGRRFPNGAWIAVELGANGASVGPVQAAHLPGDDG